MARTLGGIVVLALCVCMTACDGSSPTAPAPPAAQESSGVLVTGAAAHAGGTCPPDFTPIDMTDANFDPTLDANGDGILCVREVGGRNSRLLIKDNRVQGKPPSTARLTLGLEVDG